MRICIPAKHILFCCQTIWHDVILIISDSASLRRTYIICNNNQQQNQPRRRSDFDVGVALNVLACVGVSVW